MSIATDLKFIISGIKKAKRDYLKVKAFNVEHDARHETDANYSCGEFSRDFFQNLGNDVHPNINLFEAAAYRSTAERYSARERRKNPEPDVKISFTTIEMDGDETVEEIHDKIVRAIRDKDLFDEVVSETAAADNKSSKKKRGDK